MELDNKSRIKEILAKDISFSEKISNIYSSEIGEDKTLELCQSIQNNNEFDFFKPFFEATSKTDIDNFFIVRHFVCKLLPNSKLSGSEIFELVDKMITFAGNDFASDEPVEHLIEWLKKHQDYAKQAIKEALEGSYLEKKYFTQLIYATQDKDSAILMANSIEEESLVNGIRALCRINFSDSHEAQECLDNICEVDFNKISDTHQAAIIFCVYSIFEKFREDLEPFIIDIIDKIVSNKDTIFTNYELARFLSNVGDSLSIDALRKVLNKISKFNHENRGTLNILDYYLCEIWSKGHHDLVNEFILKINKDNSAKFSFKDYSQLARSIYSSINDVFCAQVVFLFNTKNFKLCVAAKDLLSEFILRLGRDENIDLDFNISPQEAIYFCKKIVGFIFHQPKVITRILLNIIRRMKQLGETNIVSELCDILFDPIMTNYGSPVKICEAITNDDIIFEEVSSILEKNKIFFDGIKASDDIKELYPSEIELFIERDLRARDFEKATKEARKKSVFLDLVSHVSLLYGKSCITVFKDLSGNTSVTTNNLSTISQMAELPRCEIWDKVSLHKTLLDFRHEDLYK